MDGKKMKQALLLVCLATIVSVNQVYAKCSDRRAPGMDWSGCKKTHKMLDRSNFSGSRFDFTNLYKSSFDGSNFNGASLVKADLTRVSATATQFNESNLTKAVGYRANFTGAVVKQSNMTKTEFSRANFTDAEIADVDWSKSELGRAIFSGARLERVNFAFTNLSRVDFGAAQISDVNFKGAYTYLTRFEDVDLRGALNLHEIHLKLACGNENTQLPEGLSMPENWPCKE